MSGGWALADFQAPGALPARCAHGFEGEAAQGKAEWFRRSGRALLDAGCRPHAAAKGFHVPGRVEVLGKHADYAGGRTIVAPVERGFCVVAVPRDDPQVHITDACSAESCRFAIEADLVPAAGHWSNYPMTVARRIARNLAAPLRGADIAFASDLPPAAGMSSSSAMIVASFLALREVNHLAARDVYRRNLPDAESLAEYLGTVENGQTFRGLPGDRGVGTFGGSEDHVAILCARAGMLSQYSYCPVRFERTVPLPPGYCFAVAASGVAAKKTGEAKGKYNLGSRLAGAAAALWREATGREDPHLGAVGGRGADRL